MKRKTILINLLPLLIPFLAIFGCGLLITALQSFGLLMFSYSYEDMLFAYKELFNDLWFMQSVMFSLYVSTAASIISIFLGTLFAYWLWNLPSRFHSWAMIYKVPLILPHIAVGFIALIVLSKTGVLASLSYHAGFIHSLEEFPDLLYSRLGVDLISAYVYKETPFVMVMVYAVLCRFDRKCIDTAVMLGASGLRVFFTLILPFIMPVLNTTFCILFVFTFGGFDLPFVLGNSYPGMLSIRIYEVFFQKDIALRPLAMAMLTLVFLFSIIFIIGYLKVSTRLQKGVRKL